MLNHSLGKLTSVVETANGLHLETAQEKVAITTYADNCIHLYFDKKEVFEPRHSYAVVGTPQEVALDFTESKKNISLKTKKLTIAIDKKSCRFSFFDKKNQLLNEDDFATSWLGSEVTCYKKLQEGERFIGLGEKTGGLDRRGQAFVNWNTDSFGFGDGSDPLYASLPFYMGIFENRFYGIFLDSSCKSKFNFGAANHRFASFSLEGGPMSYFFMTGDSIAEIIQTYSDLTGYLELPPKWSLGYQQCRYSYYPESEVRTLAQNFRDKQIPVDVLHFDIHYMDKYKVFTWDKERFPDHKKLIADLREMGMESVLIFDPGIKVEEGYEVYDTGLKKDVFVKYPDGKNYEGDVWPGKCHFPDFTAKKTRKWWGKYIAKQTKEGLKGFWCDMNEPAAWGKEIPDLIEFDMDGRKSSHKEAHNVYGLQMAKATKEAASAAAGKRTFVLTRAAFSGIQRYAALWTGDNVSDENNMLLGARMVANLGLAGVAFSGYDVGGFVGQPSPDLYARWIALGAFAPFYRTHTMINTGSCEPWSFGEKTEEIARNYISLRYRLMPYLYSAFYEATQTGMPVARSLVLYYPEDGNIYAPQNSNNYLFGDSLMICPVKPSQQMAKIYFPEGKWYSFFNDTQFDGGQEIFMDTPLDMLPVFVKESAIIPEQSLTQTTKELPEDILKIHVYKGRKNNSYVYYEDDGASFDYQDEKFFKRTINYQARAKKIIFDKKEGKSKSHFSKIKLYLHGFSSLNEVTINGKNKKLKTDNYEFIYPISNFDPWESAPDTSKTIFDLPYVEFRNGIGEIVVEW